MALMQATEWQKVGQFIIPAEAGKHIIPFYIELDARIRVHEVNLTNIRHPVHMHALENIVR